MVPELSPLNERFVAQALAAGLFPSREALLDRAVEALRTSLHATAEEFCAPAARPASLAATLPFDDTSGRPLPSRFLGDDFSLDGEPLGARAWDSDAVMRRIFESLAEAGVRTND